MNCRVPLSLAAVGALALLSPIASAQKAGDRSPQFDFTDAYNMRNDVDPAKMTFRVSGNDPLSVVATTREANRRNVRVKLTVPARDQSGKPAFFSVLGELLPTSFTADAAGRKAKQIADKYPIYVFPEAGTNSVGINEKRQEDLMPLDQGYFSNNPLGLWVLLFVNYDAKALKTKAGAKVADDLRRKNGVDRDGTPLIKSQSDLEKARKAGIVTVSRRKADGTQGAIWSVCPAYKDPRRGAIAPDAFLAVIRDDVGNVISSSLDIWNAFDSLQKTGEWPKRP